MKRPLMCSTENAHWKQVWHCALFGVFVHSQACSSVDAEKSMRSIDLQLKLKLGDVDYIVYVKGYTHLTEKYQC